MSILHYVNPPERTLASHPLSAMNLRVEFDPATAAKVAVFFETNGMSKAAAQLWQALSIAAPYDMETRKRAGDALYEYLIGGDR